MRNVPALLQEAVSQYGDRNALMWKHAGEYHTMTYEEFWQLVQSFAYGLQELGVRPGSKVAILSNNSPAWAVGDYGILACGAVTVPIYQTLTAPQIGFILQNADVEIVLVENSELATKVRSVATDDLRSIIKMTAKTKDDPLELLSYHQVLDCGYTRLEEEGPLTTWQSISESDLATIVHTSGTTGNPKGVMLTHENLLANISGMLDYVPMQPTDLTLSYLPLSHIFERTCGQFAVLASGATICYAESIATIADNLLEVRPTTMTSVPRLFEKIYDGVQKTIRESSPIKRWLFQRAVKNGQQHLRKKTWLSRLLHPIFDKLVFAKIREKTGGNLRLLVSGGAALHPVVGEFFAIAGLPICEGYGMTETSPVISTNPMTALRIGTVGKPLSNLQVKIASDGEVLVKGPSVMVGYYKDPEATEAAFTLDGWLHTGDIGELVDGYLRIVERKKNILVLATGKNVAPFPIESALSQSPYISQAILFGDRRKYVSALLIPDFEELHTWAQTRGLDFPLQELVVHPEVHALYQGEIDTRLAAFATFEKPKKFVLLPEELTLEKGELTATLKVRMHVLEHRYQAEIASMYEEESSELADSTITL